MSSTLPGSSTGVLPPLSKPREPGEGSVSFNPRAVLDHVSTLLNR
jgi:hypothetical protein